MTFLEKLKPKLVSTGKVRALELDADIFLRVEMKDINVFITKETGTIHIATQSGSISVVLRLTETF